MDEKGSIILSFHFLSLSLLFSSWTIDGSLQQETFQLLPLPVGRYLTFKDFCSLSLREVDVYFNEILRLPSSEQHERLAEVGSLSLPPSLSHTHI